MSLFVAWACVFVCVRVGCGHLQEQMFWSLLQGSWAVKQPPWCAGIFYWNVLSGLWEPSHSFFLRGRIFSESFPMSFYIPGIPANRSYLAIASAPYLFLAQGVDSIFSILSFSLSCLHYNFLCVWALSVKIRTAQIQFVIFSGCLSLFQTHYWLCFLTLFLFHVSQIYFSVKVLSTLSLPFPWLILTAQLLRVKPTWRRTDIHFLSVQSILSVDSLCLNLSHLSLSVSVVFQDQQCVPSTWSSWRGCLMGGSRSRNHPSLFGHPFQMKSFRSQGADGCNEFMHLCSGCYQRTLKMKTG